MNSKVTKEVREALCSGLGSIDALLTQCEQMRGMFPDNDGAIARAVDDAEEATEEMQAARDALDGIGTEEPQELEDMNAAGALARSFEVRPVWFIGADRAESCALTNLGAYTVEMGRLPDAFGVYEREADGTLSHRIDADDFVAAQRAMQELTP